MEKSAYTVGWICALSVEMSIAVGMLDECYSGLPQDARDRNTYTLGRIGPHHVVIACLPAGSIGSTPASLVAEQMGWTFPSLRFGLMVGIGGGVPSEENDIRLGDVVVSVPTGSFGGVIQYDFGKTLQQGRFQHRGSLNKPPAILMSAVSKVASQHRIDEPRFLSHLSEMAVQHPRLSQNTRSPGIQRDQLFEADYDHPAKETTCAKCSTDYLVVRPRPGQHRPFDGCPLVHYGLIASGNRVMKDGVTREQLRKDMNVLCFEMEAAGLMDEFPCLVVRGICDYADSHKNDEWQPYAAATAAAYAKELLLVIAPGEVAKEEEISTLVTHMSATVQRVDEIVTGIRSEYSMQLMDRLSSVNFWAKQQDVYSRVQKGTGTWIFDDPTFKSWLAEKNGVLWCRGIPGAGKTLLTSVMIDHLVKAFENKKIGLAWIYLDYRERDLQTIESLFAGLLRQLIQKGGNVSGSTIASIGVSWREGKPNFSEYKKMLQKALQQYNKTIIVIDALDESRTQDLRKDLVSELRSLKPAISLLITSRPLQDIREMLTDIRQIEILAHNEDVTKYLDSHLQGNENLCKLVKADPSLQDVIKKFITRSDDGMFLKAALNLHSVEQLGTSQEVTRFFMTLPDSYAGIYESYMKQVEAQDQESSARAIQVLSWLSHALGPLTINAIQHALSMQPGDAELREGAQPDADSLVSVCCNFVVVDQNSKDIRLVHETAQEHLKNIKPSKFPAAHSIISSTCLTYLSLNKFLKFCRMESNVDKRLLEYPFYRYAAQNWPKHVVLDDLESSLQETIVSFLESSQRCSADETMARHRWSAWGADKCSPWTDWNRASIERNDSPLHAAATYGLRNSVTFLLEKRGHKVDQRNNFGETALHRAAQVGQTTTMSRLILHGAELNAKVQHHYLGQATPTILASVCLQTDALRVLLNHGVDVNASDPQNGYIPLHFAASMSTDLTHFLLDRGANPNLEALRPPIFPERGPMTSLHFSVYFAHAYNGAFDRVKLLLDNDAYVNKQTGLGNTALHMAISGGHQDLAHILLEREADIYLRNRQNKSAIQLAQELGHFSWVERWVSPQILDDILRTTPSLTQAIWANNVPLVHNLIEQDINLTEKDQNGKSPWDYCVLSANVQIAEILADYMDSKDLPDSIGSDAFETALTRMTAFDHTDNGTWESTVIICRRLLKYRKAFNGNLDFAKARAFVGNYNSTNLIWAAHLGRRDEVEFLLECGADVDAQDQFLSTAAHCAALANNISILGLLVDHGANLSIKDRFNCTPLQRADKSSHRGISAFLEAAMAKRDA